MQIQNELPQHLKKYIVEQNYEKYTPIDHACWRYILRQLKSFLSTHAHESYLEGLEKTGVEIERIPKISEMSKKLEKFGWRALPVSGFIPPAAFMELQSLKILPIASDMRSLDHLQYTPAPDIVHEAAGHAPILVNPEFSEYLKKYNEVANKAIISREDLDLYEAIRILSDAKENPESTETEIESAEKNLSEKVKALSHVSEATELSRMNWWTAEYGLVGDLQNPKIYGAGLLSSVGESRWCLNSKVKKIPLTVECIKQTYDITEPQPQLFVAPDFKALTKVLKDLESRMAFRTGGLVGAQKALRAKSVNTVQFNSGLQVSGLLSEIILEDNHTDIAYLIWKGPTQLSCDNQQLDGHGVNYHEHGFGTPVGHLKVFPDMCPSELSESQWDSLKLQPGEKALLEFTSGVTVHGIYKNTYKKDRRTLILSFTDCTVKFKDRVLFSPDWGVFDMVLGCQIPSVFGGPADRDQYGYFDDFVAARVPVAKYSDAQIELHELYRKIRFAREQKFTHTQLIETLSSVHQAILKNHADDWLLLLECYELALARAPEMASDFAKSLKKYQEIHPNKKEVIDDGLALAHSL